MDGEKKAWREARQEESEERRRWEDHHVDWTKIIGPVPTVLSIVALIFSIGVNYQKLATVDGRLSSFIDHADQSFVRRDVESEQVERLTYRIQMLQEQVEMLREELRSIQKSSTPSQSSPRFGR